MFKKILIANRGEIACRVIKTARRMGIGTVAVYSEADRNALHVSMADEAIAIGPPPAAESYLLIDRIVAACRETGAEAVHPGYGFLSERAAFPEALAAEGIAFIGPPPTAIEAMGDKITSKKLASEAGVSTVPGYMGLIEDAEAATRIAGEIGYPVMIKASAGGGGKGMRIAWKEHEVREGFQASKNEAKSSFGDDRIFIEKFVTSPRHIEIQVLADRHGTCLYLGERECSIQRRNQKVIEEAPSPFLDEDTRRAMGEQSVALAQAVGYASAGTVEFIVDDSRNFYFLEMNTRLQVEHPVTELITGIDLVEQMIRVAAGEKLAVAQSEIRLDGWAMESRLYAEDPYRNFLPSIGRLNRYRPPAETEGYAPGDRPAAPVIRNDTGVYEGGEISMYYDPMIAKLCTWAPDRSAAIEEMRHALDAFEVEGIAHNLPFLSAVMDHPRFVSGEISTGFIAEEYPEGFAGADLPEAALGKIAGVAAAMQAMVDDRDLRVKGQMRERISQDIFRTYVVSAGAHTAQFDVRFEPDIYYSTNDGDGPVIVYLTDERGEQHAVNIAWRPGQTLARIHSENRTEKDDTGFVYAEWWGDVIATYKVEKRRDGFRFRTRGADLHVSVMTPRIAELAALMPEKLPPDTSKMLLCPMPGVVVSLAVSEGDAVEEGQALCTVEAMKMENVLRAGRRATVSKINAEAGASLAVDDVIMEFD
ncbi:MAG: acetyl/propionyl/methylcrotonyl-CoA carboxylase subunit alpha [Pseudomonadota bacterium]